MSVSPDDLPSPQSIIAVQKFVVQLAPQLLEEFGFVTALPWTTASSYLASPHKPENVLTPDDFSPDLVAQFAQRYQMILVPCTFETEYEQTIVNRLLEMLDAGDDHCVFMLQLLEIPSAEATREYVEILMERQDRLLAAGANAVLVDPEPDADRLRRRVEQERAWFEANARRANSMFATDDANLQRIVESHHELHWESLPKALMPKFAPIDENLVETSNRVGSFQLVHRFRTVQGTVLLAVSDERQSVVIKAFDKSKYVTSTDLECVYREFRFLSDVLSHPNIIHCLQMLHSLSRVYFVLEFGGMQNMYQLLQDQPGYRLDSDEALDSVLQIANALHYCHSQNVAHRRVSLEHIVVEDEGDRLHCRLVDFQSAVHSSGGNTSLVVCGDLPCIAPEVALGEAYIPHPADCWSLGVVLLEAAGGLGSLMQAVGVTDDHELEHAASMVYNYFCVEGNTARALATMGGVRSDDVLANLNVLVKPVPSERARIADVVQL